MYGGLTILRIRSQIDTGVDLWLSRTTNLT